MIFSTVMGVMSLPYNAVALPMPQECSGKMVDVDSNPGEPTFLAHAPKCADFYHAAAYGVHQLNEEQLRSGANELEIIEVKEANAIGVVGEVPATMYRLHVLSAPMMCPIDVQNKTLQEKIDDKCKFNQAEAEEDDFLASYLADGRWCMVEKSKHDPNDPEFVNKTHLLGPALLPFPASPAQASMSAKQSRLISPYVAAILAFFVITIATLNILRRGKERNGYAKILKDHTTVQKPGQSPGNPSYSSNVDGSSTRFAV